MLLDDDKMALTLCSNGVFYSDKKEAARDLHWSGNVEENDLRLLIRKCPAAQDLWEITYSVTFTY